MSRTTLTPSLAAIKLDELLGWFTTFDAANDITPQPASRMRRTSPSTPPSTSATSSTCAATPR